MHACTYAQAWIRYGAKMAPTGAASHPYLCLGWWAMFAFHLFRNECRCRQRSLLSTAFELGIHEGARATVEGSTLCVTIHIPPGTFRSGFSGNIVAKYLW